MSDRIYVRRYVDPLRPPSMGVFRSGFGRNSGNLIFAASAQRTLTVDGVDVETNNLNTLMRSVDRLNDEGRHVVIPLANAFRPDYLPQLTALTQAIERLTVPVTILGVGGQFALDGTVETTDEVDEAARRFMRAILARGPALGVRGERTAGYLNSLGFSEVDVIGCPSMFLRGGDLSIRDTVPTFGKQTKVSLNLTPHVPIPTGWVNDVFKRHPRTEYVAQDRRDLDAMLGGPAVKAASPEYPSSVLHRAIRDNHTVFHCHAPTWIDSMADRDFTVGHRIHGNITSLLAGTPAHVIVHDSRTRELCEYFEIPHTHVSAQTREHTPQRLFESSDYKPLIANHPERLARFAGFLERHGLRHVLDLPAGEAPFDRAVAQVEVRPGLVIRPRSSEPEILDLRAWNTARAAHRDIARATARIEELETRLAAAESPRGGLLSRLRRTR
ncbi:polysaccharide pyruvyl transferase family protein [Aeromicrobium duanguangcaii]|uniref:polysaccharide pyruvyl transferase family protein n=1 Tax=Aeromicrobium duanguangcaii TaxID=2968086 RepID=UPI002017BC8A|nr:polysaccharide pyruvyl transferase family protein [Aeromicrobium duanguangcaii]